ncbi:MAG: hypothetical protein JHD33_07635 [Chthoniobacterales bacterium]|nr:hypothetical protein [Chthoniobacterales bacterium]
MAGRDGLCSRGTGVPPVTNRHHRRDACAPWKFLVLAAAVICAAAPLRAEVVFNWGSPVYSTFRDSYGNPLDASYTFQLGAFDPSFAPTAGNVALWGTNWKVFDQTDLNVAFETFASTADMLDDGTSTSAFAEPGDDFRGLDAYVWGFKTPSTYGEGMEWVWFRAPSWTFPTTFDPGPPVTPTEWSTSDLVAGDVPLWGAQNTAIGLGYASAPGVYTLQTYTIASGPSPIPEPSTIFFAALLLAFAVWHRRKTSRAAAASLLAAALLLPGVALANRINFYSTPDQPGYGSDGLPLDENTSFELGVFSNGFAPSATNTDKWSANWVPAQRAKFSRAHNWFTAVCQVTNTNAPFTVGTPVYVWGFNGSEAQGQWILYRSTSWTWPQIDDTAASTKFWSAKDANVVVLGSLPVAAVGGVGLRPVAVANSVPPATKWNQWKLDNLGGNALGNPSDDADGDGIANILEFISGTSPNSAADRPAHGGSQLQTGVAGDKSYLEVRVTRRRDRPATFSAEVSSDLSSWTSGANAATELTNAADAATAVTMRDKTAIGEGGTQRFMRVKVTPQ